MWEALAQKASCYCLVSELEGGSRLPGTAAKCRKARASGKDDWKRTVSYGARFLTLRGYNFSRSKNQVYLEPRDLVALSHEGEAFEIVLDTNLLRSALAGCRQGIKFSLSIMLTRTLRSTACARIAR